MRNGVFRGEIEVGHRSQDPLQRLERLRDPDHVHIHGEAAVAVSGTAVAPAAREPPFVIPVKEAHQVAGGRLFGVGAGELRHEGQTPDERIKTRPSGSRLPGSVGDGVRGGLGGGFGQETALSLRRHVLARQVAIDENRKLEVVVDHPVVFPRSLQVSEQLTRTGEVPGRGFGVLLPIFLPRQYQGAVLGSVLPDGLAPQRLLVAHVPLGIDLPEDARDHKLLQVY